MASYDKVWKYIQFPADFIRDDNWEGVNSGQSHHSQVISSNLVNVHEPQQSFAETFTKRLTNANCVIFPDKTVPTFVFSLVHSL